MVSWLSHRHLRIATQSETQLPGVLKFEILQGEGSTEGRWAQYSSVVNLALINFCRQISMLYIKSTSRVPCRTSTKKPLRFFCVSTFIPLSLLFKHGYYDSCSHRFFANTLIKLKTESRREDLQSCALSSRQRNYGWSQLEIFAPTRMTWEEERILIRKDNLYINKLLVEIFAYCSVGFTTPFE